MQPIDMNGARRCGSRRSTEMADDDSNGYVETDPTGRYGRFDELLGRGSMKSVYKAFDEVRGVEVAWNQANLSDVLRTPDALHRIYAEVHLLAALRHDAIISFHASWVDTSSKKQTFNFVTELFSSGTLRAYRLRHRRVSHRAVRSWARQLLRGLAYLHSRDPPVIHRDLKCDNVFVNGHLGQLKIGDLGLAAVGARAGSVVGTPEFMAPEMYDEDYDARVDVYSFGMCVLEMLTAEYPYAECSNPAQIYKKVTAGKLPDAFHRLDDGEARRFIGRCLVAAAQRPSAEELLLDPFLDDHAIATAPPLPLSSPRAAAPEARKTGMTITGKLNAEDDSIFLKVQLIADESAGGRARNIYFPFDIVGDTAMEVAKEMVKELEIEDREPSEIAAMIEQEIARLVPGWRGNAGDGDDDQHEYTYADDEHPPPFYYLSSSPSSSQGSHYGVGPSTSWGFPGPHGSGWSKDFCYYPASDDDDVSSVHSSGSAQPTEGPINSKAKATRFGPEDGPTTGHQLDHHHQQRQRAGRPRQRACLPDDGDEEGQRRRRMNMMRRNRSMVDMRSQLLHRSLVDELNKRLFFNTVGTVQDIGFRDPTADDRRRRRNATKDDKHKNIF